MIVCSRTPRAFLNSSSSFSSASRREDGKMSASDLAQGEPHNKRRRVSSSDALNSERDAKPAELGDGSIFV